MAISNFLFFFNDTATTEIYTLSLHDALPIFLGVKDRQRIRISAGAVTPGAKEIIHAVMPRNSCVGEFKARQQRAVDRKSTRLNSRSHLNLVCRLLLEKKKTGSYFATSRANSP